jgi:hypothetical protein
VDLEIEILRAAGGTASLAQLSLPLTCEVRSAGSPISVAR